jgi:hypothetical protein
VAVSLRTGEWLHHGVRFNYIHAKPSDNGFKTPITGAMLAHKLNTDKYFRQEVKKLYGANAEFLFRQGDGQVTEVRITETDGSGWVRYLTFPCDPLPLGEDTTFLDANAKEVLTSYWTDGYAEGTDYLARTLLEHLCREQEEDTPVWCHGMRWEADHRFQTVTIYARLDGEGSIRHTVPVSMLNDWANVKQHMYAHTVWAPYSLPDNQVSDWMATVSREKAESY